MLSTSAALLVVLFADVVDTGPEAREPPRPSEVRLSVVSGTPAVLPGLTSGVSAELQHQWADGPLFVGANLRWTSASAANQSWLIDHQEFVAAASVGLAANVGVGRLWASVGGGAAGLYEVLSNHQIERLQAAGVPGGTQSAFAVGPYACGDLGIAVVLRGAVRGFVAGGPTLRRTVVDGAGLWRLGALGRFGVAYDF